LKSCTRYLFVSQAQGKSHHALRPYKSSRNFTTSSLGRMGNEYGRERSEDSELTSKVAAREFTERKGATETLELHCGDPEHRLT
jgi:hypothetical protein